MAEKLAYEIVTPENLFASSLADQVIIPGVDGDFGVLAGHAPFMSTMRPGVITILGGEKTSQIEEGDQKVFVKGGLAQVSRNGLTILAEETIDLESVTLADISEQLSRALGDLDHAADDVEKTRIETEIGWLQVLERLLA